MTGESFGKERNGKLDRQRKKVEVSEKRDTKVTGDGQFVKNAEEIGKWVKCLEDRDMTMTKGEKNTTSPKVGWIGKGKGQKREYKYYVGASEQVFVLYCQTAIKLYLDLP